MNCMWNSMTECNGKVEYQSLYCDQIRIHICELHKAEAEAIQISYKHIARDITDESIISSNK